MSGSKPGPVVLLDDTSEAFYSPQAWTSRQNEYHFGGGQWVNDGNEESSISCAFEGTSITFYGRNQTQSSWTTELIFDEDESGEVVTMSSARPMIYDFLTSPTLPEGSHTVTLKNMRAAPNQSGEQPKFDYAYVTPGRRTNVMGKLLMVDDDHESISYTGNWVNTTNPLEYQLEPGQNEFAVPHRNGTHVSRTNGDAFSIDFVGTSIALGGFLLNDGSVGRFSLKINIDDQPSLRPRVISTNGNPFPFQPRIFPNYIFYRSDTPLSPGPHTVKVEVMEMSGDLPFVLDYVLYTAAFQSFEALDEGPGGGGEDVIEPPDNPDPPTRGEDERTGSNNTGAIVGGAVGGAVFAALMILFLFFFLRRRRRQERQREARNSLVIETEPTPFYLRNEGSGSTSVSEATPLTTRASDVSLTGSAISDSAGAIKLRRLAGSSVSSPLSRSTGQTALPPHEYTHVPRSSITEALSDAPPPYEPDSSSKPKGG